MSVALSLTEVQIFTALRSFLLSIMPVGMEIVKAQDNRVPEPAGADFITMTPLFRERLSTNVATYTDTAFTGSITGNTLTVTNVSLGSIKVGAQLLGNNLAANTVVKALGTGTGGVGTYVVTPTQTLASQTIAAGVETLLQSIKFTVQLDVHGPNSADNVQVITTLFRDRYGVDQFATSGVDVTPLYANDPHQMPFLNGEQQVEDRWAVDVVLQCNPVVSVPQQFADQLDVNIVSVDAAYPAV
jgi:hypothetical protein